MGELTKIQWTDHTMNFWVGCTKVSTGCAHCYAERDLDTRLSFVEWGAGQPRRRTSHANWRKPFAWASAARDAGVRRRVFSLSLGDWLDEEVPLAWLSDMLDVVDQTRSALTWQLLTKRPENFFRRMSLLTKISHLALRWIRGEAQEGIWLGVSVEDQENLDRRWPILDTLPARVKFLSAEPLLGPLDLRRAFGDGYAPRVGWVIVGGESGPSSRCMELAWARSIVDQCERAEVSCFVKQLGFAAAADAALVDRKGGDPNEWPEDLRVRSFPTETQEIQIR